MPFQNTFTKNDLKALPHKEWGREHVDGCPVFMAMTIHGFTTNLYDSDIPAYSICLCYYQKGQADWFTREADYKKIGGYIVRKFLKDKNEIYSLYKRWLKNFNLLKEFYYQTLEEDLSKLSNAQLLEWADNVYMFYRDKASMPGFIDGFMFYADKRLDFLLRNFCKTKKIKNYHSILSHLSAPVEPSFIGEEKMDLALLVEQLKRYRTVLNGSVPLAIKEHLKKYSWFKSSYIGYSPYRIADLKKTIHEILEEVDKPKIDSFVKSKRLKKQLIKKYKFTPEILALAQLSEIFIKWQDQRKNYTLTFVTLQHKIVKEIAQRLKIDLKLLRYATMEELPHILTGNFNIAKLSKREASSLFVIRKGKILSIFTGKTAKDFFAKVYGGKVETKNILQLKGITASLGYAKGRVKIVLSARYISKVKKGDILVAPMTRPEHLIGMQKAAAIVTDEGGITSHAAIISRELGIPCIIGTKIATRILRDGEIVEVDANKGIILRYVSILQTTRTMGAN